MLMHHVSETMLMYHDSYYNPNFTSLYALFSATLSRISLAGLAVMGQNLALNIAEKGFQISVYNRTTSIVDETLERAAVEGNLPVSGQYSPRDFVLSLRRQCRRSRTCLQLNVMILEDEELPSLVVVWVLLEWAEQYSYCCSIAKKLATLQKQDRDDFKKSVEGV
ncbi:hypothetical protein Bca4012_086298 [Brassica carinata]